MKIVIAKKSFTFKLSNEAARRCLDLGQQYWRDLNTREFRSNPVVVRVVEELGKAANGEHAQLKVIDVPLDDIDQWDIVNVEGREVIQEIGRTWDYENPT